MQIKPLFLATLVFWAACAQAQTTGGLDGTWAGTVKEANGSQTEVQLKFSGEVGTWHIYGQGVRSRNACAGVDLPIIVKSSSATDLAIQIEGGKLIRGCLNQAATFKSTDGKTLEGAFADGRAVSLTRK